MIPWYIASLFSASVSATDFFPILFAYSSTITETFFVTQALSTSIEFSFLIPSVAPCTASQRERAACLPKLAASLKRSIITFASSKENPLAKRFLREVAALSIGTSPSAVKSLRKLFAAQKSCHTHTTTDSNPFKELSSCQASLRVFFIPKLKTPKAAPHTRDICVKLQFKFCIRS